jgi:hypothetical protein
MEICVIQINQLIPRWFQTRVRQLLVFSGTVMENSQEVPPVKLIGQK